MLLLFTNHLLLLILIFMIIHESPPCIAVRSTPKFDGSKHTLSDCSYKARTLHGTKDYVLFPGKPRWTRQVPMTLAYAFSKENMINYLHITDVRAVFQRAFGKWASVIPVSFVETDDYDYADIRIGFYSGDHGDGEPFDGVLGLLAHSFSPESGKFHLDAAETWAVDFGSEKSPVAVDLESVAVHEIGHLLGLAHSPVKEAVMYPTLKPRDKKVDLALDDIKGVQALYGSNPNFTIGSLLESDLSTNQAVGLRIKSSFWATMMLHLENYGNHKYRICDSDDMITHIIKVNNMLQEIIWEGGWIRLNNRVKFLRNTLSEIWYELITDIWESVRQDVQDISVQYNVTIERFAVEYIRRGAKWTATPLISPSYRHGPRFVIGFLWLPKIQYQLPPEFKDLFPKTMIIQNTSTGKVLSVKY